MLKERQRKLDPINKYISETFKVCQLSAEVKTEISKYDTFGNIKIVFQTEL